MRRSISSFIQQIFAEIVWQALGDVLLILTDHLPGKRWSQVAGSVSRCETWKNNKVKKKKKKRKNGKVQTRNNQLRLGGVNGGFLGKVLSVI